MSKTTIKKSYTLLIFFPFLLLISCGDAARIQLADSSDSSNYSGENLEGGAVSQVSFNSNTASLDFGAVSDDVQYILALYSYDESGSTQGYQLDSSENLLPMETLLTRSESFEETDMTEDFHQWLREKEEEIVDQAQQPLQTRNLLTKASSEPNIGDTRSFEMLNSFSSTNSYTTVTGVLKAKTSHIYCYIDSRDVDALSDEEVTSLINDFDDLLPQEQAMFGSPSDVDSNGHEMVLMSREVNKLGGSQGGIITGFFYAQDLFDRDVDMFYTFVPDPEGEFGSPISKSFAITNILPSVLLHEYQHIINFNMHYFVNEGSTEKAFLNEALSHFAEDLGDSLENPARAASYLSAIEDICITCGASLAQRGGSYLLVRYLYEQADKGNLSGVNSGEELIDNMLDTTEIGVDNIVLAAYGSGPIDERFRDLMGQFGLALFLSNTGLTTDDRLQFTGINLRSAQDDNRGTVLRGPAITPINSFPLVNTVSGSSISFIEINGEDINDAGGSMTLEVGDDSMAGAYLIQTGL